jgi:xanthine dehydrogenase YagS FAD-binding subunit
MHNFAYARAASIDAVTAATVDGAAIIAGGTEFLNWLRLGIAAADKVVDIGRLNELRNIAAERDDIRIGALATLNDVGESRVVRESAPVLAEACLKAASAQLRNRATLGGNILQKTRCPYFRAEAPGVNSMPWPCNKRVSGSGCAAKESRYPKLALFGWNDACVATQPSDPAVALAALDATVEVVGPNGHRSIPMTEFHLSQQDAARENPSRSDSAAIENRLGSTELIVGFRVPIDAASRRSAYVKVRERESYEYAMVSAAAALELNTGRIRTVRIALGSVAQKPWRLTEAEAALRGQALDAATLDRALDAPLSGVRPLPGNEFKVALARNAARRALLIAGGGA